MGANGGIAPICGWRDKPHEATFKVVSSVDSRIEIDLLPSWQTVRGGRDVGMSGWSAFSPHPFLQPSQNFPLSTIGIASPTQGEKAAEVAIPSDENFEGGVADADENGNIEAEGMPLYCGSNSNKGGKDREKGIASTSFSKNSAALKALRKRNLPAASNSNNAKRANSFPSAQPTSKGV